MKKLVLFGAGVYAKKYKSLLDFLGMEFDYFSDNDSSKFGKTLYGKRIIEPEMLKELECNIVISCTHGEQLKKQFVEMGIINKLIEIDYFYNQFKKSIKELEYTVEKSLQRKSVIVDMYEGVGWGGTEVWASNVAEGLLLLGYKVTLFGSTEQKPIAEKYEKIVEKFPNEKIIERMVETMINKLPFVLINNFSGCAYLAAVLLKIQFPDSVRIINVVHNDNNNLFQSHMMFREWVDAFICVSSKIKNTIIRDYEVQHSKVFFREQPIMTELDYQRIYPKRNQPLKIGYAARLVKQQKRADLFPQLLKILEAYNINFIIEIAGEGDYLPLIDSFIRKQKMEHKVILLGRLLKDEMPDFWKRQDVYLNFSEYEGMSLAMLEAMGYACVPVVTRVSGVDDFIMNNVNGVVCNIGDLDEIAKGLLRLDNNKDLLKEYGETCRKKVIERCNQDDYICYISRIINGVWDD